MFYSQKKEDEVTWQKINMSYERSKTLTESDFLQFLIQTKDIIVRSMASERSKLSGTTLSLLNNAIIIISKEKNNEIVTKIFSFLDSILPTLIKLTGKSNKVICTRAECTLIEMGKALSLTRHISLLKDSLSSISKNIRLGVYKLLESNYNNFYLKNKSINENYFKDFIPLIMKGKSDVNFEIRDLCKRMCHLIKEREDIIVEDNEETKAPFSIGSKPRVYRPPQFIQREIKSGIEEKNTKKEIKLPSNYINSYSFPQRNAGFKVSNDVNIMDFKGFNNRGNSTVINNIFNSNSMFVSQNSCKIRKDESLKKTNEEKNFRGENINKNISLNEKCKYDTRKQLFEGNFAVMNKNVKHVMPYSPFKKQPKIVTKRENNFQNFEFKKKETVEHAEIDSKPFNNFSNHLSLIKSEKNVSNENKQVAVSELSFKNYESGVDRQQSIHSFSNTNDSQKEEKLSKVEKKSDKNIFNKFISDNALNKETEGNDSFTEMKSFKLKNYLEDFENDTDDKKLNDSIYEKFGIKVDFQKNPEASDSFINEEEIKIKPPVEKRDESYKSKTATALPLEGLKFDKELAFVETDSNNSKPDLNVPKANAIIEVFNYDNEKNSSSVSIGISHTNRNISSISFPRSAFVESNNYFEDELKIERIKDHENILESSKSLGTNNFYEDNQQTDPNKEYEANKNQDSNLKNNNDFHLEDAQFNAEPFEAKHLIYKKNSVEKSENTNMNSIVADQEDKNFESICSPKNKHEEINHDKDINEEVLKVEQFNEEKQKSFLENEIVLSSKMGRMSLDKNERILIEDETDLIDNFNENDTGFENDKSGRPSIASRLSNEKRPEEEQYFERNDSTDRDLDSDQKNSVDHENLDSMKIVEKTEEIDVENIILVPENNIIVNNKNTDVSLDFSFKESSLGSINLGDNDLPSQNCFLAYSNKNEEMNDSTSKEDSDGWECTEYCLEDKKEDSENNEISNTGKLDRNFNTENSVLEAKSNISEEKQIKDCTSKSKNKYSAFAFIDNIFSVDSKETIIKENKETTKDSILLEDCLFENNNFVNEKPSLQNISIISEGMKQNEKTVISRDNTSLSDEPINVGLEKTQDAEISDDDCLTDDPKQISSSNRTSNESFNSNDFTKLDSQIYANKNAFTKKKEEDEINEE
ncbi:hypothetical protein LUQ84_000357 [Hamiltosporidium tvaerminnensis]|nr:hypothetical protein LUQ84_000357 [Hamiltosporidium tvaerminnensis]